MLPQFLHHSLKINIHVNHTEIPKQSSQESTLISIFQNALQKCGIIEFGQKINICIQLAFDFRNWLFFYLSSQKKFCLEKKKLCTEEQKKIFRAFLKQQL